MTSAGTPLDFDKDVLELVGNRGRSQILVFLFTSFSGFFFAFHHLGSVFLAATPAHLCQPPATLVNSSNWPVSDFIDEHRCHFYYRTSGNESSDLLRSSCATWIYDHTNFQSTVVTVWDLVCDKAALASLVQAIYMGGIFLGTPLYGYISDRHGRRRAILIAIVEFISASMLASISVNYVWFITCRLLTGMGAGGIFSVSFVLMTEFTAPEIRDVLGIAYQMPFAVGCMVLPGLAYFLRQWYNLQLVMALLGLLLLNFFWFIPESPRWLFVKGRLDDALPILERVARINGTKGVDIQSLTGLLKDKEQEHPTSSIKGPSGIWIFLDLFKTPQMRKRILVSYITWAAASMCYYGLSLKAPTLGNDRYFIAFLAGIAELVSLAFGCIIIRYLPRKRNLCLTFLAGGVACLLVLILPSDATWAVTALALCGKFFISITYSIVYLYTTEIFPTQNRNVALGTSSMCARVGATSAPFIVDLLGKNTPLLIFGSSSLLAGCLALLLPETRNRPMPETIEDVERPSHVRDQELMRMAPENQGGSIEHKDI